MCRIVRATNVLASYVKRNLSYDLCNKLISPSEKIQNIMYSTIDHFFLLVVRCTPHDTAFVY